ncbi:MAG: hypothetical protein AAFY15_08080, partial [Cyanobacteria bacterium J06648_11]
TCPWVRNGDRSFSFEPVVLDKSVVDQMRNGYIHHCHSVDRYMCSGYLAFAEQNLDGGANSLQMVQIADRLGIFNWELLPDELNVFESFDEMLDDHAARLSGRSPLETGGAK